MGTPQKVKVSAIQSPTPTNGVMVAQQLKESVEVAQRLRGDPNDSFVRVSELTQGGLWTLANGVLVPTGIKKLGGTVTTAGSVQGDGSSGSPIELVNDSASPGNSMVYGTNSSGTKGWQTASSGGSTTLAGLTDVSITSPANGQVLTYVSSASKWENQNASGGASNITPDTHPSSPTAWDDEFEFGSVLDTTGARFSGANAWTIFGGTSASWPQDHGAATPLSTANVAVQTLPSGSWTFVAKVLQDPNASQQLGMVIGNRTTGKAYNIFIYNSTTGYIQLGNINSSWSYGFNSNLTSGGMVRVANGVYYLMASYNSGTGTFTFSASNTGLSGQFFSSLSRTIASDLGAAALEIGLGLQVTGSYYDWFRRTA